VGRDDGTIFVNGVQCAFLTLYSASALIWGLSTVLGCVLSLPLVAKWIFFSRETKKD
jgi:hypothetical protein